MRTKKHIMRKKAAFIHTIIYLIAGILLCLMTDVHWIVLPLIVFCFYVAYKYSKLWERL